MSPTLAHRRARTSHPSTKYNSGWAAITPQHEMQPHRDDWVQVSGCARVLRCGCLHQTMSRPWIASISTSLQLESKCSVLQGGRQSWIAVMKGYYRAGRWWWHSSLPPSPPPSHHHHHHHHLPIFTTITIITITPHCLALTRQLSPNHFPLLSLLHPSHLCIYKSIHVCILG